MSDTQISTEHEKPVTPQEMRESNNLVRKDATRPGWVAVLGVLVFLGALVTYMANF